MDQLEWKQEILFKLGRLFGPLLDRVEHPERYSAQETARIIARYCAEYQELTSEFERFTKGEPGHNYQVQNMKFYKALLRLPNRFGEGGDLAELVSAHLNEARTALDEVPVPTSSVIYAARTPFSFYRTLRGLCEVDATQELLWLDAYVDSTLYTRYLTAVRSGVPITVVTEEPGPHAGRRNVDRWNDFLDISRLYAQEHGPAAYRLIIHPSVHDRWVVFDQKRIYSLGGSAKDAAVKDCFTLATVDANAANLQLIQDEVANGVEWFGPNTPIHR